MINRIPGLPEPVRPMLERYAFLVNEQLPGRIYASYIVGSLALGEFNERFSDIDFLTVLNRPCARQEFEALRGVHGRLEGEFPRWKMSGSYLQPAELGKPEEEIAPHPHYHDGVLHLDHRAGLNPVTWWELKHHGIPLIGAGPTDLPFSVDVNELGLWTRRNMNSYWARWTNRPGRILMLYSDWGIQWAVPGVLRQYYTLRESSITTKVRAARYALGCLPTRWHRIIQEAIDIRQGEKRSAYRLRIVRMIEAVNFLKYIIQLCNPS